jgi:hypothetical protein
VFAKIDLFFNENINTLYQIPLYVNLHFENYEPLISGHVSSYLMLESYQQLLKSEKKTKITKLY